MSGRETIIAGHGNKDGQLGGRSWADLSIPLLPVGVRLFYVRSLVGEGHAIIAVPPKPQAASEPSEPF